MDWLLDGGYERDALTTIYGPPGSGKTLLCLLCAASVASEKRKVIYIDTEGNFSAARFEQICPEYKTALKQIVFLRPTDFAEQAKAFEKLKQIVDPKRIGFVILDGAAMLYRLELGKSRDVYSVNREFGLQLSYLTEIARRHLIPVLVTNQVYADFDNEGAAKIVGGDILRYASKCLIEIRRLASGNRLVFLRKHRSLPEDKKIAFKIVETGIEEAKLDETQEKAETLFSSASEIE